MKHLTGTLRIAALVVLVGLLFVGGETQSADSHGLSGRAWAVSAVVPTPVSSHATGGALVLAAYGFLLIFRRRTLR